jgi:hypothetical protein
MRKRSSRTTEQVLKEQEQRAKAERENAVAKAGSNALAGDGNNPWLEMGTALEQILGLERLRFAKEGGYFIGETDEVPLGTRGIGHVDEAELGYKKWVNNQCVDTRWGRIADKFIPPPEDELPDNKPVEQDDGSLRRPWQFGMLLPVTLMDAGGQTYGFGVTGKFALGAVSGVIRAYGRRKESGQPGRPILELQSDKKWVQRHHTWVNFPKLIIVGWTGPDGKPLSLKDDLNDDLPDQLKGKAA